jgi:hypothetical protein
MGLERTRVLAEISKSPFNKQFYEVNISISNDIQGVFMYTGVDGKYFDGGSVVPIDKIFDAVPVFQRSNNQWSQEMQISFVKNILSGFKTHISLFQVRDKSMVSCEILDGLQRVTALVEFFKGNFKVFGHTYQELKDLRVISGMRGGMISLRVYTFENLNEAIDFYVSMNENITHSPEDIQKAISFKEK